jgi:hypothetical protein
MHSSLASQEYYTSKPSKNLSNVDIALCRPTFLVDGVPLKDTLDASSLSTDVGATGIGRLWSLAISKLSPEDQERCCKDDMHHPNVYTGFLHVTLGSVQVRCR